ncbi:MAG: hypothetical protein NC430_10755 [bacterium]|nr:hypothetical protein [bacterium]MCM1423675.1 hypothetical protein [bacterium]
MKKMRFGTKLPYIIPVLICICVLACAFLYEKDKTDQDTEQDNEFVANEAPDRDAVNQEEAEKTDSDTEQDDILVTNGVSDGEKESLKETELTQEEIVEEITAEMICEKLREVDFTIKEYPINEEIYTEEMDREYKEVFLQVLLNQMPVQYEDGEETYFEDIDPDKEKLNADHITMIKEFFVYCYLDFDGDGLPELIVDPRGAYVRFGGPRIFKYDRDSKKVYVDGYRFMRYRPLCAGKFYYEYNGSADSLQYGYQEIDSQGNVVEKVAFQHVYPAPEYGQPERYFIGRLGDQYVHVEIDKESWDEIFRDFFEAMDHAVTEVTFDELFSGMEHP